ncbi:MAG: hypothetical protein U1E83_10185 [Methylotetracoccus sp.]
MIKVTDIAPDQWTRFCEDFSRQHRGRRVATSVIESTSPYGLDPIEHRHAHLTARDLPLTGLAALPTGCGVALLLGEGKLQVHESIPDVSSLHALETLEGACVGLRIDRLTGSSLLLSFRVPACIAGLDCIPSRPWKKSALER